MITALSKLFKPDLIQAKSFLCWDKFPDLAIQLIPITDAVAYFYPPRNDYASIVLFYPENASDFNHVIFLLFHEAGHYLQYQQFEQNNNSTHFSQIINSGNNSEKVVFEKESWLLAAALFKEFIVKQGMFTEEIMESFQQFSQECVQTYLD